MLDEKEKLEENTENTGVSEGVSSESASNEDASNENVSSENVLNETEPVFEYISEETQKSEDTYQISPELEKAQDSKKNKKKMNPVVAEVLSWVKMIAIAFILAVVIDNFIIINATVPTSSMENTIMTGSRMIGFRFSYIFSKPERGDIIIFKYPLDESQTYVKRVIGLPGETVVIEDGEVRIYEAGSDEYFVLEEDYLKEEWTIRNDGYEFNIPEGCYLVLGDNRNASADARVWLQTIQDNISGINVYNEDIPETTVTDLDAIYVAKDKILGKAIFTYWPLDSISLLNNDPYED